MSSNGGRIYAVYVDGESKTGKGAAGKAVVESYQKLGLSVYYAVGGDFFRRYAAITRRELGLDESSPLIIDESVEALVEKIYKKRLPFYEDQSLGNLQRPSISESVAILSRLPLVQKVGQEWFTTTLKLAAKQSVDVLVFDGRNPRLRVAETTVELKPKTIFDLFLTCQPDIAALRSLLSKGVLSPTKEQQKAETANIINRRLMDQQRAATPFVQPSDCIDCDPLKDNLSEVIESSWKEGRESSELPYSIKINNSHLSMTDMLSSVSELATLALAKAKS